MTRKSKKSKSKNKNKNDTTDSEKDIEIPNKNDKEFQCFVPDCKEKSVWSSKGSLLNHLIQHLAGHLKGTIPSQFFSAWKLTNCSICGWLISTSNKNGYHKKCERNQESSSNGESSSSTSLQPTSDLHSHPFLNAVSWKQIFKLNSPTVTRIPGSLKSLWGTLLYNACRTILHFNDANAWKLFFLLPELVLRIPKRGGSGKFMKDIENNMKRWQNGEIQQLFNEKNTLSEKRTTSKHNFKRSFKLCTLGRYSDALRALDEQVFCADDDESFDELNKLHPKKPHGVVMKPPTKSLVITSNDLVANCLKSFPKGSAPGLDGYRAEHLMDATNSVQNKNMSDVFKDLLNLIIAGKIHPEAREWFAGGKLCALSKDDGGVRPICMGSVIGRLCSKIICRMYQDNFSSFLAPCQVGVGVKSGVEILIHEVDLLFRAGKTVEDLVLLKIDFRNAFNMVDRQTFLDCIHKNFPELYNFVASMYGVDAKLLFYGRTIHSEEGTRQGDPLGPVLFAVALKIVTDKLVENVPDLMLNRWYLDDGYVAGKVKKVAKSLKVINKAAKKVGLELRTSKSVLFYPSGTESKRDLFPTDIKVKLDGINVLGAPIGSEQFISEFFALQYAELRSLLKRLEGASSDLGTHATFTLLTKCISFSKMVFHARTVHPSLLIKHASNYDQLVRDCFLLLIPGLSEQQLAQSSLPIRSGGLGVRRLSDHLLPAFLSSAATAVRFLNKDLTSVSDYWALGDMLECYNAGSSNQLSWMRYL